MAGSWDHGHDFWLVDSELVNPDDMPLSDGCREARRRIGSMQGLVYLPHAFHPLALHPEKRACGNVSFAPCKRATLPTEFPFSPFPCTGRTRSLPPVVPRDAVWVGSLAGWDKIHPREARMWFSWLRQEPKAQLVLSTRLARGSEERVCAEARSAGIHPSRLWAAYGLVNASEFSRRLHHLDLWLDTFPYGAHSSAGDAIAAGVPVLARRGLAGRGRVASSFLRSLSPAHEGSLKVARALVCRSAKEAGSVALRLIRDDSLRWRIRGELATRFSQCAIGLPVHLTRSIERAWESMWEVRAFQVDGGTKSRDGGLSLEPRDAELRLLWARRRVLLGWRPMQIVVDPRSRSIVCGNDIGRVGDARSWRGMQEAMSAGEVEMRDAQRVRGAR